MVYFPHLSHRLVVSMSRLQTGRNQKIGLPPGSLVHIGEKRSEPVKITVFDYDQTMFEEKQLSAIKDSFLYRETETVSWLNIDGVHDAALIESLGKAFELHPLVLEDIMNTNQRPKIEFFDQYVYLVVKMLSYDEKTREVNTEQVSIIIMENMVISFQERPGDLFDPVRERIRQGKGRVRRMGPDYLAYSLIDAVVDHYFVIMESIGGIIELMEDKVIDEPTPETLKKIYHLKANVIVLRKSIWPLRELINSFLRDESIFVSDAMTVFLRDLYDHSIQVMDTVETYRDMVSGLIDIYMSSVSNKMNEVMKVLTIFASIFIPLTFVAGIYGMNFNTAVSPVNMPELNWFWGYPFALIVMILMAGIMLLYFKRKQWL